LKCFPVHQSPYRSILYSLDLTASENNPQKVIGLHILVLHSTDRVLWYCSTTAY
jgi:hypothetical protein